MNQEADGVGVGSGEPQPVVLPHDRDAGFVRVPVWSASDLVLLSLVFGDEGVPDPLMDILDGFRGDRECMLVSEGFFDASQDASLLVFHGGNLGHEADADSALARAVRVCGCNVGAAAGAVVVVKVILGYLDFLWWWEVFDSSVFDVGCGSEVGAAPWTCVHGDGDDFVRFWLRACGAVVSGWGASPSRRVGPAGVRLESLHG